MSRQGVANGTMSRRKVGFLDSDVPNPLPALIGMTPYSMPIGSGESATANDGDLNLSIVVPAKEEAENLPALMGELSRVVADLSIRSEVIIVTDAWDAATTNAAQESGATVLVQAEPGYGRALRAAFAEARGRHIITMDADLAHSPELIRTLWKHRDEVDVLIASRYAPGGTAKMPRVRLQLSRLLNKVFSRGLSLHVSDMSSGYRLYRKVVLTGMRYEAVDFDILQEILVRAYSEGWRVAEMPFRYVPARLGSWQARVLRFGLAYVRRFWVLWKLRNSILCADYDARAYDSPIPLQRYWQRARHRHVMQLVADQGRVLDVGCGSSRIIEALPRGSVAVDILLRKLRFAKRFNRPLVCASAFALPFPDRSFPCVLCSQVIEHVPKESTILDELCRVLQPGGCLVIGTPDYANWEWVVTEKLYGIFAPGAYADEHIAHYTRLELVDHFVSRGFTHEATRYILRGELILAFRAPGGQLH